MTEHTCPIAGPGGLLVADAVSIAIELDVVAAMT